MYRKELCTIRVPVSGPNGLNVTESLLVRRLSQRQYQLVCSPALLTGIAADDVVELQGRNHLRVVRDGGNICVHVSTRPGCVPVEELVRAKLKAIGGWIDGKADFADLHRIVLTFPRRAPDAVIDEIRQSLLPIGTDVTWAYAKASGLAVDEDGLHC